MFISNKTPASFGSLAKYRDVERLFEFNDWAVLGFGGDVSDMQAIVRHLTTLQVNEENDALANDEEREAIRAAAAAAAGEPDSQPVKERGSRLAADQLFTWLSKLMYARRSKVDPLWNNILVAGVDAKGKPFLSGVDLLGTTSTADCLATGFGAHIATPILRKYLDDKVKDGAVDKEDAYTLVTKEEAEKWVAECMKVLYYRDARSLDQYSIAVVPRPEGGDEGEKLVKRVTTMPDQNWGFADRVRGYGTQIN